LNQPIGITSFTTGYMVILLTAGLFGDITPIIPAITIIIGIMPPEYL
jgi:hypothetical protein